MLITIEARFTVGIDLLMTIPQEQLRTYKKRYIKILRLFAFSSIAKDKTAANSVSTWPSSLADNGADAEIASPIYPNPKKTWKCRTRLPCHLQTRFQMAALFERFFQRWCPLWDLHFALLWPRQPCLVQQSEVERISLRPLIIFRCHMIEWLGLIGAGRKMPCNVKWSYWLTTILVLLQWNNECRILREANHVRCGKGIKSISDKKVEYSLFLSWWRTWYCLHMVLRLHSFWSRRRNFLFEINAWPLGGRVKGQGTSKDLSNVSRNLSDSEISFSFLIVFETVWAIFKFQM